MDAMLASIPYLEPHALALTPSEGDAVRVHQPFRREVTNIVGTMHAGALFTLAETAAGVAAYNVAPDRRPMVLLRQATVRYTRRVEGDVTASGEVAPDAAADARDALAQDGRADVTVAVRIADAGGTAVFDGDFDYAMRAGEL